MACTGDFVNLINMSARTYVQGPIYYISGRKKYT